MKEAPKRSPEAAHYVSSLKTIKELFLTPYISSKVGSVGVVHGAVKIRQRIDDESALVEVNAWTGVWTSRRAWTSKKISVQVHNMKMSEELMLLRGLNIRNLVDGDSFKTDRIFVVSGTSTYETAIGGSKTVLVIEPVGESTEKKIADRRAALDALRDVTPTPQPAPEPRTWTDASGAFAIEATFRGIIGGTVRLEREDGKMIEVPLERLSNDDQEWIKSRRGG